MLNDLQLEIPYVSQLSFAKAAQFYSTFVHKLRQNYKEDPVKDGKFGAHMQLSIESDGPVTIVLDSKQR
ncbi:D-tyrosyl-tRNA(Tyr) deacylase 1 [Trichinella nelsoni]|uniref:D-aminoacyl-tRNA deacylase n=1 Tax=Trichinella nelsoni TaxID=6336 RepID=A0A0V0SBG7_9BILA|nr:D-tyrosyl-tRNA(Tyr) deacylase 1 [Trichinella nelsoni]